uniref:Uncharacterized protein n=1 Tax=Anguilla anguilla TaxID=7936 RepID=A0A0E9V9S3_ANGAN
MNELTYSEEKMGKTAQHKMGKIAQLQRKSCSLQNCWKTYLTNPCKPSLF